MIFFFFLEKKQTSKQRNKQTKTHRKGRNAQKMKMWDTVKKQNFELWSVVEH